MFKRKGMGSKAFENLKKKCNIGTARYSKAATSRPRQSSLSFAYLLLLSPTSPAINLSLISSRLLAKCSTKLAHLLVQLQVLRLQVGQPDKRKLKTKHNLENLQKGNHLVVRAWSLALESAAPLSLTLEF